MYKEDLEASPAELLFGQCLRLPGDIIFPAMKNLDASSSELIQSMLSFSESLHPIPTRVQQNKPVFLPKTLEPCTHIFVKEDPIHPNLSPAYSGPYRVLQRNNEIFKIVKRGKIISIGINNIKPGFVPSNDIFSFSAEAGDSLQNSESSPRPYPRRQTVFPQKFQDYVVA